MNKLEARKLYMLVSQRKKLEEELLALENEILNSVWHIFLASHRGPDSKHRKGSLSQKLESDMTRDRDPKSLVHTIEPCRTAVGDSLPP